MDPPPSYSSPSYGPQTTVVPINQYPQPGQPPQAAYPPQPYGQPQQPYGQPQQPQPYQPPQPVVAAPPIGQWPPPPQYPNGQYPTPQAPQGVAPEDMDGLPTGAKPWEPVGQHVAGTDIPLGQIGPRVAPPAQSPISVSVFLVGFLPLFVIVFLVLAIINPTGNGIRWLFLGIAIVFYVAYWISCLCNAGFRFLLNPIGDDQAVQYMRQMIQSPPIWTFHVRCGHRQRYYTHHHTRRGTHRSVHYRWVTTFAYDEIVPWRWWKDLSNDLNGFEANMSRVHEACGAGNAVMAHLSNNMALDLETVGLLESRFNQLYMENCWRDRNCFVTRTISIPNWNSEVIARPDFMPWWMSKSVYVLACTFGLFFLWRWQFNSLLKRMDIVYTKLGSLSNNVTVPGASAMQIQVVYA